MNTVLGFLLTIWILVVVHEYGHYLVARLSGVKVLRFSVGFGPVLLRRILGRDQTEWTISAVPLGGYVKMLDEREEDVAEHDRPRAFNRATVWRRMAIVAAGPLANFLLAIVAFWVLFVHGVSSVKPMVGTPDPDTPAALAGLRNGDEVTRVDGKPVQTYDALLLELVKAQAEKRVARIELLNGELLQLDFSTPGQQQGEVGKTIGLTPYFPPVEPVIGHVEPGSPAVKAGLQAGDRILAVNGQPVDDWQAFAELSRTHPGSELALKIESSGRFLDVRATPASIQEGAKTIGRLGVAPKVEDSLLDGLRVEVRYSVFEALGEALRKTWDITAFSLNMMGKMVAGQVSLSNLSGPVSIASYAGQSVVQGWASFTGFLAVISIGLGIINLLPIPLLDGGHLMYYIAEVLRGRPVSERAMELGNRIGLALIGTLVVLSLYNDLLRLLNG